MRRFLLYVAVCLAPISCLKAPLKLSRDDSAEVLKDLSLRAPDPSQRGTFAIQRLYYGSGTDKQRKEFRDSVTLKTATVDGSKLASAPSPDLGKERKAYWGFDFSKMPVNGRVWYPDGAGPFPLVLIVHGNHDMKEFSDPGYQYLGELLASRGFILASVDENFLNGNIRGENDARGWMLLQHLRAWKAFNDSAGSPFYHKVDMQNIALMGHSRGGEAVAVAGLFNRLAYYPDDANVKFDFHFGIKSLVAIAPVDGQYRPAEKPTPLENYNYLLFHGTHDGDVSTFSGLTQWERLRFTENGPWFKSAVMVYRANHGQWNSVWGSADGGPRSRRFLDLRGFISQQDQRRFAEVYVSAFLEATLRGKSEYLPLFRDYRTAGQWLPKTMYTTRFQESSFRAAANFEEDVDVTTGSLPGVTLRGDSLSTWKEAAVPYRSRGSTQAHNAASLAWNNRVAGPDTTRRGKPASYEMTLSDSLRAAWRLSSTSALVFSLAPLTAKPGPRSAPRDTTKKDSIAAKAPRPPARSKPAVDSTPMDMSVELEDANGRTARVSLSDFGVVRRPLESNVYLRRGRDAQRFATNYEVVLQTYVIPLSAFPTAGGFDPVGVRRVRWVFDKTDAGTVWLDNIGFSNMRPEFWVGRAGQ